MHSGKPDDRPTVVLDANVLFSQVLSDYFVQARSERLVALRWSSAIVEEMIRNRKERCAERYPDPAELNPRLDAIERLRDYIERTYRREYIEPTSQHFRPFDRLPMPDPDDRHVLATALAAHADYLCTSNTRDFPDSVMRHVGIERTTPDELLHRFAVDNPLEMVRAHQTVVDWTPGTTHQSTLDALRRAKALATADRMQRLLTGLGDLDSRDDLAQVYASALAERDRAQTGLMPPTSRRPGPGQLGARPVTGFRDRQRLGRERGVGGR